MPSPPPIEKSLIAPADAEARYWDAVGTDSTSAKSWETLWREHSDAVNCAWLEPRLRAGRVLKTDLFDEALTDGLYPLLAARCDSVVGIDFADSTVRAARERQAGIRIAAADVRRLPFAPGVFDCVVSTSTLDHIATAADIGVSLQELHRVLRPGGRLLLTLDNFANPVVALRNSLPFRPLYALGVVPYQIGATCTPPTLRRMVQHAGFEVIEIGTILHCPRVLAVAAARLLERRGSSAAQRRFLAFLSVFERLGRWPTRFVTGHFSAIVADRR